MASHPEHNRTFFGAGPSLALDAGLGIIAGLVSGAIFDNLNKGRPS